VKPTDFRGVAIRDRTFDADEHERRNPRARGQFEGIDEPAIQRFELHACCRAVGPREYRQHCDRTHSGASTPGHMRLQNVSHKLSAGEASVAVTG
jgi:hypothetical protein